MKTKPLLSCEVNVDNINFPIYVSTKFDGVRALVIDGIVYSRSLKPIRNKHVQNSLVNPNTMVSMVSWLLGIFMLKMSFRKQHQELCLRMVNQM